MRQKMRNAMFTFLYPGRHPGQGEPPDEAPQIAIPDNGEFCSISCGRYGGEISSAVFYDPRDLRQLAEVLHEAADIFENAQADQKYKRKVMFPDETTFEELNAKREVED